MRKQILITTLIAGCLDITGACTQAYLSRSITPDVLLKYIASGFFGKDAFTGGFGMMMIGLLVHFFIVLACTLIFFLLYPKLKFLQHSIIINSLLIALVAWTVTNLVIIPMSNITTAPINYLRAMIGFAILFICIGLPISISAKKFYTQPK
jgi:hypothetical protein